MSRVMENPPQAPLTASPWQPTAADTIFLVIVLLALRLGQSALLNDPGTPWHIQVGLDVWKSGPPHVDTYSYTRAGESWLSQSWLFDCGLCVLYGRWSWDGIVVASAIVLGWVYRSLFRLVLDAPANVAWAGGLTVLAAACGAGHWLVRPHLLSLGFVVLTVRGCMMYHRTGSRVVWLIPPVMALWCNVHGAFLAGLVILACSLVGQIFTPPRDPQWRKRVVGFSLVLGASLLATLVNPYGTKLHAHLGDLLFSSGVRDLIDEWRAPDFQAADARPLEILLLLLIVLLAVAYHRIAPFSLVHLVAWIHFALLAVRQVAFFGLVAAPVLGELSAGCWPAIRERFGLGFADRWVEEVGRRSEEWAAQERTARWPVYSILISALLFGCVAVGIKVPPLGIGTAHLSPTRWPLTAMDRLNNEPADGPLFNDLNWGGFVILNSRPRRPVFADDRFELYGRKFIREYLDALQYGPSWKELLAQYEFEFVLIRSELPLARVLAESNEWEVLHQDGTAILLKRRNSVRLTCDLEPATQKVIRRAGIP